ncbi:2-oxoacid ferredoxin oxidoreductase [Patescibacteria group bacterium]|nr:2-oxoacid ferredoxin oxidoreductase [Patescibacteria group bacterium]
MKYINNFDTDYKISWCTGCGNFGILAGLKKTFIDLKLKPYEILITYGVGCHAHMVNYLSCFGVGTLHGRPLPVAQGAKIANKKLTVLSVGGDGDQVGEGTNHLIHACKRNIDVTCLIHNNRVYGLTTGQASPTSPKSYKSKTTPDGVVEDPINPLSLALVAGASFVARAFTGDVDGLSKILKQAINHKGLAVVEILQPCVTFNYINTYSWYKDRVYNLSKSYNFKNKELALKTITATQSKIPLGVFYKQLRPIFSEI